MPILFSVVLWLSPMVGAPADAVAPAEAPPAPAAVGAAPAVGGAPPSIAPAAPGSGPVAPAAGAAEGAAQPSLFKDFLPPLLLMFAVFWFLIIMPERRKQKARQLMIKNVKKGDEVVTTAGIIGRVMKVEDEVIQVQVDKEHDFRIVFQRSALVQVLPDGVADPKALAAAAPVRGGAKS